MSSVNRWVFYKPQEDDLPLFADLIWWDQTMFIASGASYTTGSPEKRTYPDDEVRDLALQNERDALEEAGYKLSRQWHHSPNSFDFELLQQEIEDALRALIQSHPGKNAFALYTDGDRITLSPVLSHFDSLADADDDELFLVDDWSGDMVEMAEPAYRLMAARTWYNVVDVLGKEYCGGFDEACIGAFETLQAEGLLGAKEERIVLYAISDNDQSDAAMKRLNTPRLYQRWKAWIGDDTF